MSPINFAGLATERPDLALVFDRFGDWAKSHPTKRIIDPKALARFLRDVPPEQLLDACLVMVRHGLLRQAFMVESEDGLLIGKPYKSPLDIPERVEGRFGVWVDTADARDVVPVFVEEDIFER